MAADSDVVSDAIADSKYAADISRKMQVPDRITVSGGGGGGSKESPTRSMMGGFRGGGGNDPSSWSNQAGVRNPESAGMMQVPDRILLAGNNAHVAARSTPRELQLENSVVPTSPEHVRVYTPPRSIRLDDNSAFPASSGPGAPSMMDEISDDEFNEQNSQNTMNVNGATQRVPSTAPFQRAGSSGGLRGGPAGGGGGGGEHQLSSSLGKDTDRSYMMSHSGSQVGQIATDQVPQNMTTFEELQLVRRQIAKLNHRLMAVELENQQQQQREMIFTVLVTAYFFGKFVLWVNRNT